LIKASKLARTARKNLMRKKTSIGHVEFTSQNGVVRCGGAVVKEARINLVVSSANMRLRTIKKMKNSAMQQSKSEKDKNNSSMSGAYAVKRSDTQSKIVSKIPILELMLMLKKI
jgi:hypothetical protein